MSEGPNPRHHPSRALCRACARPRERALDEVVEVVALDVLAILLVDAIDHALDDLGFRALLQRMPRLRRVLELVDLDQIVDEAQAPRRGGEQEAAGGGEAIAPEAPDLADDRRRPAGGPSAAHGGARPSRASPRRAPARWGGGRRRG